MVVTILICFLLFFLLILWGLFTLFKKRLYLPLVLIVIFPYVGYKTLLYFRYKAILPSAIEVTYPISVGEEGVFREGCSIAIYKLSDSTLDGIKKNGVSFFDGVTQARGHSDYYHKYAEWKETPIPPNWTSEGSWFICSNLADKKILADIVKASKLSGAFYTTMHEGELVVVPSLKLVVFSSFG
jgi:hypothetical protein